ncbi:MAG: hypothetical protein HQ570_01865 [Candidatus Omnitrophica bacterium]|nr:hypothetical protein [Candidatus Omnitrophota bacterium]
MKELCKNLIKDTFSFHPSHNQLRVLKRLIFEVIRKEHKSLWQVIDYLKKTAPLDKYKGRNKFIALRNTLIKYRFPQTSQHQTIEAKSIFLNEVRESLSDNWQVKPNFKPLKIFVETNVAKSQLLVNFQKGFPNVEIQEIDYYSRYLKKNKFTVSELKKPLVFIVKERGDFIKKCPCTKKHLPCGYWILNLGFGCPFDCSYCFLQQYSNFPGIILPANIEDFLAGFDKISGNFKRPIRIGTGEFCDSLALDHITEYSKTLIPYFKDKKVLFELKTKSNNIANLLTLKSSANIIISWSLGPASIIKREEKATASLDQRLKAAARVQDAGFSIGFHFDPIIHLKGWQQLYGEVINKLYSNLKCPFAWISLGTLRSNRRLKTITELRFPQSDIFYGELFLGADKKLRYPEFIKEKIYQEIIGKIRQYDKKTPIYLCMEDKQTWANTKGLVPLNNIENSLIA